MSLNKTFYSFKLKVVTERNGRKKLNEINNVIEKYKYKTELYT